MCIIVFIFLLWFKFIPFGAYYILLAMNSTWVPKFSKLDDEFCMFYVSFKSFRSIYILDKELDTIMNRYEKKTCGDRIYYYNKVNDITISEYGILVGFPLNKFYIVYEFGELSKNEC